MKKITDKQRLEAESDLHQQHCLCFPEIARLQRDNDGIRENWRKTGTRAEKAEADRDALLAAMGEKDEFILRASLQIIEGFPKGHKYESVRSQGQSDTRWMFKAWFDEKRKALSTTPQDAYARLRNEAKAEAFEEAAKMAPGSSSGSSLRRDFNRIAIDLRTADASGKREGLR